jgi:GntR family transcriptional regulator
MAGKSSQPLLEIHGAEPLYRQIEKRILQCLAEGEWKPGDQLPTESQLAQRFGVAVFTVRAGIGELVAANILVRKQGKGTFVARHTRLRERHQFSHLFRHDGTQLLTDRKLLSFERQGAPRHAAEALELPERNRPAIYRIFCLQSAEGEPAVTLDIHLPVTLFPGLTAAAIRESEENLYAVYQDVCGINVIRVEERIFGAVAKPAVARVLAIPVEHPVLRIERIAYTYNDLPVEFRIRHVDAGKYHYRSSEGGV